jgi:hypothetical protein
VSVVVVVLGVAGSAAAAEPSPRAATAYRLHLAPPPDDLPSEPGLALGQFAAGAGTAFGGLAVMALGGSATSGALTLPLALGTPALVGLAVCHVGGLSTTYDGSCAPAIGGAVVGALSAIPLALLGFGLDHHQNDEGFSGLGGALGGALIGWVIVQPLAATLAWRLFKHPRRYVSAALPAAPRLPVAASRPREHASAPGQLTASLVSTAF